MKSPARHLYVHFCLGLVIVASLSRPASAQNIVEQRIVIPSYGVWNWDTYSIHGHLHLGTGVPNGRYSLHFTERNGTNTFSAEIEVANGQPMPPEWVWSDFTYQARFVPDGGWTMAAVSATGISGPAQGITVPASGENTVWRLDKYYTGNVPADVNRDFDLHVFFGGFPVPSATPLPDTKCVDDKLGGNQEKCQSCNNAGMARYSVHSMLVSLNIQDTPLHYLPPRGPAIDGTVTYNQKESQQPAVFSYSNLGPRWTLGWLSYITDNPAAQSSSTSLYLPGGGTEVYLFDPVAQTFLPEPQSHALLVRTGANSYEKRFPDGSRHIFNLSSGATTYPRKLFMTQMIDPTGNSVSIGYDDRKRVSTVTDALGQVTTISYELATDPLKITKVTDPFGRFATFQYEDDKLVTITDTIGIQSQVTYHGGTDSVDSLTTPYGTTTFTGDATSANPWIEITDPLGGKERVEYRNGAPGIGASEPVVPSIAGVVNDGLDFANTFYWDKKAMSVAPGDYSKARIKHWLYHTSGSVAGILSSEKLPLENRVWYTYAGQPDYQHVGPSANPSQVARVLADGTTQLSQYEYNPMGKTTKATDPAGRVMSYSYDVNQVDLLEIRQTTGTSNDLLRRFTYNSLHEVLTDSDASGEATTSTYNAAGQILTRQNAKLEVTTYAYGNTVPFGYLASVTSPAFYGVSAVTRFGYDNAKRVRTVTNETDQSTVTTDYDNLDRKIRVTYPDTTYQEYQYTDSLTGVMTLDLTGSRDRLGHWTKRHYNANRQLDSITDPDNRTTLYGWCTCGSLTSITDPNGNATSLVRDLQSRVYQKIFADDTTIDYLFEGQTAPDTAGATGRLKSSTDALNRRTNYSYFSDDNVSSVSYTDISGNPLNPPTPTVSYTYDPNYSRIATMSDGTGLTAYTYYPINSPPALGAGKVKSIDGPLSHDEIFFNYDELGRTLSQSVDGVAETVTYDSLGRLTTTDNALGHFIREYDGVTSRLQTLTYPNRRSTKYSYFGNDHDRQLQTLLNQGEGDANALRFDYTYDAESQIKSVNKSPDTISPGLWLEYDNAQQFVRARNAKRAELATRQLDYSYDDAGNWVTDADSERHPLVEVSVPGISRSYVSNGLNQIDSFTIREDGVDLGEVELTYDSAGNLTDDGEGKTFEWDAANRLTAITYPGARRSEFTYDGLNRRVQIVEKTAAQVISTKQFIWIGNQVSEELDANGMVTRRYFGEGEERIGSPNRLNYYTRDHLGSVREITDKAGRHLASYDYDPYGRRKKVSGDFEVDFGYTGHYHHGPSGLNLALYRAYNPDLGRWISRDPLGERAGINLYQYVQNNPSNRIDPLGLLDFRYYGNWGGPGWTGGQWRPYEDLTPLERANLSPPVDAQDQCYLVHDICYSQCRARNGCTGSDNPSKEQRTRENSCEAACDYGLAWCLSKLERQNWHSRLGWTVFSWRFTIR